MDPVRLNQLYYLRNVLGLGRVIMPALEFAQDVSAHVHSTGSLSESCVMQWQAESRMVVIGQAPVHSVTPFEGDRGELLKRMISAMKISWSTVSLLEWQAGVEPCCDQLQEEVLSRKPHCILVLGSSSYLWEDAKPVGELFEYKNIPCLVTLELSRLLSHPQDKKQAWEHLQKLMRSLS